jgi:hypothetical protein
LLAEIDEIGRRTRPRACSWRRVAARPSGSWRIHPIVRVLVRDRAERRVQQRIGELVKPIAGRF